ncbi:tetratricopeptide repeat protein [Emcibacter sp. SYSU 3D8]|uniref:tetratricopeptide repeat protein n=1 Tax=Emcibacter sp. SYSU 3D8 TaxID=3133969 RepID=UPI0031FE7809
MNRILTGGLTAAAIVIGALILAPGSGQQETAPHAADAARLLDPTQLRAGLCGGAREADNRLSRLVALFGIPAAIAASQSTEAPPLYDNLGSYAMAVTTTSPQAQAYFNQGLRLMFGFNHAEAIRAFKAAQRLDPDCAMCFWGESLSLGANINVPMDPDAAPPAWEALQRTVAAVNDETDVERALIEALRSRYSIDQKAERAPFDIAYADAMKAVHERFPDHQDVAVLYAEAAMDTQPWDYWEADRVTPKGRIGPAIAAIETVLAANPDHPGAIHLYIHLTEASGDPWKAEAPAGRLAALMPGQGHLVHMPSHTYYRVGRFRDSLASNITATAADEAFIRAANAGAGLYANAYYPHNVHFLLTSALMAGDRTNALAAAEKLSRIINPEMALAVAGLLQPMMASPYMVQARFASPGEVLALERPDAQFPYVVAQWHYARGVALALKGDPAGAEAEAKAIAGIRASADMTALVNANVPVADILQVAERVVAARAAQARGDYAASAVQLRAAIAIEDTIPYTEPPYWYYPLRQTLGAVLLQAGETGKAVQAFREALIRSPNNGWALYGLKEAYAQAGDPFAASATRELYRKAWAGGADPAINRI